MTDPLSHKYIYAVLYYVLQTRFILIITITSTVPNFDLHDIVRACTRLWLRTHFFLPDLALQCVMTL